MPTQRVQHVICAVADIGEDVHPVIMRALQWWEVPGSMGRKMYAKAECRLTVRYLAPAQMQ